MNARKTPIPEPTIVLPTCLGCGIDLRYPGRLCGPCLVGAERPGGKLVTGGELRFDVEGYDSRAWVIR